MPDGGAKVRQFEAGFCGGGDWVGALARALPIRHRRGARHRREDQPLLRQPRPAPDAACARHRRSHPGRPAAGGDDAGGADAAVCGGVGGPADGVWPRHLRASKLTPRTIALVEVPVDVLAASPVVVGFGLNVRAVERGVRLTRSSQANRL